MAAPRDKKNAIDKYIEDLKEKYCKLVRNSPEKVAQIESACRILSFIVAGMNCHLIVLFPRKS